MSSKRKNELKEAEERVKKLKQDERQEALEEFTNAAKELAILLGGKFISADLPHPQDHGFFQYSVYIDHPMIKIELDVGTLEFTEISSKGSQWYLTLKGKKRNQLSNRYEHLEEVWETQKHLTEKQFKILQSFSMVVFQVEIDRVKRKKEWKYYC